MYSKFIKVLFFFLLGVNLAHSEEKIVYIDMNKIMNESIPGKQIVKALNEIHKKNVSYFKKKEEELISKETKLISQKNLLSTEELEKQLKDLKSQASSYRQNKNKKLNEFNDKKINATNILLEKIQPILVKYSDENSILLIFQKKDVVIGKSKLDVTEDILKIIDKNITKIDLN